MHPFGEKSILIMDMSDQYVDFFAGLRDIFTGEGSIFYSWSKAMGGSYIGVFSYYVSSPLSVITLFFPRNMMPTALMILNILKLGLAGLSMCLYLRYTFGKRDFFTVVFSVLYATMSYAVTYSLSVMWLDGLIWLPMVLMGLERLIRTDRIDHLLICYYLIGSFPLL